MRLRLRSLATALVLVAIGLLWVAPMALAQDGTPILTDPTAAALASAAGIAAVVALITNVLRTVVPPAAFDQWGATIAVVVGVVLAILGAFVNGTPDANALVTAALVGLFGGWQSQNVNTQVTRAVRGAPAPSPAPADGP